jgi:dsRNA-specific ribonuclease
VKVESFIDNFLSDLKVHFEDPKDIINIQQWHLTERLRFQSQNSLNQPLLSTFMKSDFMLMMEAMTAPTANKPIDYERLEFYGDSVISFLVILELFLTTSSCERDYKEGELDFERIKKVSNMNLALINENHRIF